MSSVSGYHVRVAGAASVKILSNLTRWNAGTLSTALVAGTDTLPILSAPKLATHGAVCCTFALCLQLTEKQYQETRYEELLRKFN